MYEIINGILHKDGRAVFALGESYYPSFHPCKFPVPPDGDRIGEMKKDLAMMAELGFNHVRYAALGDIALAEDGSVSVDTPFIDAMIAEADKNGISVSVRQQGYAVNLRGFKNVEMIDSNGVPQTVSWFDFIRTSLEHEGILEDNRVYARELAKYYADKENVIAYQIYNEPHYPGKEAYDYGEDSIKAYRRWLVRKNILTEEEAEKHLPPRTRSEQGARAWALWRLFSRDSLTAFLDNASDASKTGAPLPTYTCFTNAPIGKHAPYHGCDLFANARSMDIVGYTCYIHGRGVDYYPNCLFTDIAQCAAELEGKQSWCVELDSRTYIPIPHYNRTTYAVLGSGCKGIVYYQWRGDCPVEGVPHPNSCGILNYDGTKTHNFDNAARVNEYIIEMNDLLMNAERVHEGVGLLHSDYAIYLCDAMENADGTILGDELRNSYLLEYTEVHKQLRMAGYNVSVTDAEHLFENKFGIKVLYVPHYGMLSPEEQEAVDRFMENGGVVYQIDYTRYRTACIGYKKFEKREKTHREKVFDMTHTVYDVADVTEIYPSAEPLDPRLGIRMLKGDGYYLAVLTNTSVAFGSLKARFKVNVPFSCAECFAVDGKKDVEINGNILSVDITDGGIILLK